VKAIPVSNGEKKINLNVSGVQPGQPVSQRYIQGESNPYWAGTSSAAL